MGEGCEASLSNVTSKWYKALAKFGHLANGAKIILVGTQMDRKCIEGVDAKANAVKEQIGAMAYIPTSALMPKIDGGVQEAVDLAMRSCRFDEDP